ncbi:MAG: SCO6745 family protein [Acidimicrobiales bacterium]
MSSEEERFARELWQRVETIHAVTYFSDESTSATAEAGVRGFWRTYFGFRAAPLGPCSAASVVATFFGFSPAMVRRAVPDAWLLLDPDEYVGLRSTSAAAALRRLAPSVDAVTDDVLDVLETTSVASPAAGRPLYAGNRAIPRRHDPVERLWPACTTLREHRGDGHVSALTTTGLTAPETLCLFGAEQAIPGEVFTSSRGWSDAEWVGALGALVERGFIDDRGDATSAGRSIRAHVETVTDRLAAGPLTPLTSDQRRLLLDALTPIARAVADSGIIPFPNPMGLGDVRRSP